ncbi:hypothetical protein QWZ13_09645 [Reinekea marina]|nr:hypothetical protein [Reinekea marina]MDN3649173.1 hypothetical protein [Reinekea marina]
MDIYRRPIDVNQYHLRQLRLLSCKLSFLYSLASLNYEQSY